ncbi:MAG: hypothetical protein IKA10_07490 [Oscillospiraceae bacterium]|nr:hypothetical protein [Oscillospiraceae bacterium]
MNTKEAIYCRKSFRSYSEELLKPEILQDIEKAIQGAKPLYPHIRFGWEIIGTDKVKCVQNWRATHYIAMFTEEVDGARENLGFIFQQVELYMQSKGIGTCWLGLGKLNAGREILEKHSGMECVMMMGFGIPEGEEYRKEVDEFKRRALSEISDMEDGRLECARLAPSAVNSQPWFFVHDNETIHVYCITKYLIHKVLGKMNKIDMGIALAHIYEENKETFEFFKTENPKEIKGHYYIGSIKI